MPAMRAERSWPERWQAVRPFAWPATFPYTPWIAAILSIAALLRIVTLGRQSLWLDEGWTYWVANRSIPELIAYHADFDAHPPLYPIVLQPLVALGGSEWLLRAPSAAASIASVWLVYVIGEMLFDRLTGLLAAFIQAISAFQIWYAQEARMYAVLLACVMLATLLVLRAQRTGRLLDWIAYGLCQGVALWIDIAAVWFIAGINVAALLLLLLRESRDWRRFAYFIGAQLLSLLVFSPWLPALRGQLNAQYVTWIPRATFVGLARTVADLLTSYERPTLEAALGVGVWVMVVALAAVDLRRDVAARRPVYVLLAALVCVPLGLAFAVSQAYVRVSPVSVFLTRQLIVASFPLYLLAARALGLVSRRPRMVLIGALLALSGVAYVGNSIPEVKEDYRDAAATVSRVGEPDDMVVFDPPYIELPFLYYLDRADHRGDSMQALSVGVLAGRGLSARSAAEPSELLAHTGRVWLVTNSDNELRVSTNGLAQETRRRGQRVQQWRFTHVELDEFLIAQ